MFRYRRRFVTSMILLLILAYLGALAVSTAHLSQLYALFNAGLPYWVSIGLAVALEAVAFLFSIISTSLGKRAGPWAAPASTCALLLVWAGNGYAMMRAAPTLEWYVVLAASCFIPVCTLMVGKVLGGQFSLLDELNQEERVDQAQRQQLHGQRLAEPSAAPTTPAVVTRPRTAPVAFISSVETFQIASEADSRADVEQSAEASATFRDITAVNAARQEPVEVRPSPGHPSGDPTSAIGPVRTAPEIAGQLAFLPDASPAAAVSVPDSMNFHDHSPTGSGELRGPASEHVSLPEASPAEAGPLSDEVNLSGHSPTALGGNGRIKSLPQPLAGMGAIHLAMSSSSEHSELLPDILTSDHRRQPSFGFAAPNSEPTPLTVALVPKSELAPLPTSVPTSVRPAKVKAARPRKVELDLTGVGALADKALAGQALADQTEMNQALFSETLGQAGITWAELDGLTSLVEAGWPSTTTPRLLSARQAVLAWAFVNAKASKTALTEELGLGKKEWVVRDVVKSVDAVLETVSRSSS